MGIIAAVTPNLLAPGKIVHKRQQTTDLRKPFSEMAVPIVEYYRKLVPPNSVKLKEYSLLKMAAEVRYDGEKLKKIDFKLATEE